MTKLVLRERTIATESNEKGEQRNVTSWGSNLTLLLNHGEVINGIKCGTAGKDKSIRRCHKAKHSPR